MHGLVVVDTSGNVLRNAVIWCDSRAVDIGNRAAEDIGHQYCLENFLNYPGNFTASKLAWVRESEPEIFNAINKVMLPGDYLAFRLTGKIATTRSGLSEMVLWNFRDNRLAGEVLDHFGIPEHIIPEIVPTFGQQGNLSASSADELGLREGILVTYRAGDQPNNALSLNVLEPGELAATAGTSGVVYGVTDKDLYDPASRVNTFIHVNSTPSGKRNGVLLCINGTGILNRWLKNLRFTSDGRELSYNDMNRLAGDVSPGSDGLVFLPYGNGAERTLENRNIGASMHGLDLNAHSHGHVFRAAQEGIVFALNYGVEIMREMGIEISKVRAGHANMYLSPVFREAFTNTVGTTLELHSTDGSQGAARGAGIGAGIYAEPCEAFEGLELKETASPDKDLIVKYNTAYNRWRDHLEAKLIEGQING